MSVLFKLVFAAVLMTAALVLVPGPGTDAGPLQGRKQTLSTTTAEEAPPVTDGCGAERFAEYDQPQKNRGPYGRETVAFSVQFKDEVSPYRVMSFATLPGESTELELVFSDQRHQYRACAEGGEMTRLASDRWRWRAPEKPGIHHVYLTDLDAGETMRLNALVMQPYDGEDEVEGYRIGSYEKVPLRNNPAYRVPRGLIEVTDDNRDTWLSPHFQLRQFLCKQTDGPPRFAIVGERLLLKLELLLEKVNDRGVEADTFAVMSGYRTPYYNTLIGNRTRYSRHLYGDAADIYVDVDRDGRMDDLNRDGQVDIDDARWLAAIVDDAFDEAWYRPFIGGMGIYGPAPHRGPFLHVDTRGFRARW